MDLNNLLILTVGIVLGTLLLVGATLVVTLFTVRRLGRVNTEQARQRYPNAQLIVPGANFFGQESLGVGQVRGNGTLIVTDTELVFQMWVGGKQFVVPLRAITGIETPTGFLGKTRFTPLLKVVFQNESGRTDAMAWEVEDLDGLKRALESAR